MKVVFLDCDGVINHHGVYDECAKRPGQTQPEDWVDPSRVALVNEICDRTGAVIVVSSSWRNFLDGWKGVRDTLAKRGLRAEVVDSTITTTERQKLSWPPGPRWDEIHYWLTWHPEVTQWVVLEDADTDGIPPENLVRTTLDQGLTREGVERAVSILESL
jgi:hypothetical protein